MTSKASNPTIVFVSNTNDTHSYWTMCLELFKHVDMLLSKTRRYQYYTLYHVQSLFVLLMQY